MLSVTQPAGEWASSPEASKAESSASLEKSLSTFFSRRKVWLEENKKNFCSSGAPTGSGGGRCLRVGTCHGSSAEARTVLR